MKLELHPEALARFHEIQTDLRSTSAKRAHAFAAEMRRIGSMLRQFPRAGTPVGSLRRVAMHRFQYSILYEIDGEVVRMTTIEPQKREPDYWADSGNS
ncbi:MAG TPA: type II toxin-antitoxin system RelE/ParE family toxin [Longimicrobium sp.]|nr:type II toxin-antitoxin system RelE/ParE family toxin [Longimicrobium sp.]